MMFTELKNNNIRFNTPLRFPQSVRNLFKAIMNHLYTIFDPSSNLNCKFVPFDKIPI